MIGPRLAREQMSPTAGALFRSPEWSIIGDYPKVVASVLFDSTLLDWLPGEALRRSFSMDYDPYVVEAVDGPIGRLRRPLDRVMPDGSSGLYREKLNDIQQY